MKTEAGTIRILNRDIIKYIAIAAMLLNHIATALLNRETLLYKVFEYIGYFTAITICYFLAEGYAYTKSRKKYALRLFIFAAVSQLPYYYALGYRQLNMLFTLLFCFFILVLRERITNPVLRNLAVTVLIVLTGVCDWGFLAGIFTVLFAQSMGNRKKTAVSYLVSYAIFVGFNLLGGAGLAAGLLSGAGILSSGIIILFFYNGRRSEYGRTFSKWFFYTFYPAHLIILLVILKLDIF